MRPTGFKILILRWYKYLKHNGFFESQDETVERAWDADFGHSLSGFFVRFIRDKINSQYVDEKDQAHSSR